MAWTAERFSQPSLCLRPCFSGTLLLLPQTHRCFSLGSGRSPRLAPPGVCIDYHPRALPCLRCLLTFTRKIPRLPDRPCSRATLVRPRRLVEQLPSARLSSSCCPVSGTVFPVGFSLERPWLSRSSRGGLGTRSRRGPDQGHGVPGAVSRQVLVEAPAACVPCSRRWGLRQRTARGVRAGT